MRMYCITLNDIHPEDGSVDVDFHGQALAFEKVKKAIYRYDVSLLRNDIPLGSAFLSPTERLRIILRRLITNCLIRDKFEENQLKWQMPQKLVKLLLTLSHSHDASNQPVTVNPWSLKTYDGQVISLPTGGEQDAFEACIKSILHESFVTQSFESPSSDEIKHRWTTILSEKICNTRDNNLAPFLLKQPNTIDSDIGTEILMVILLYCVLVGSESALSAVTSSELIKFPVTIPTGVMPLYNELLEILLWLAVSRKEIAYCEQLMTSNVNLNVVRQYRASHYLDFVASTVLQSSLEIHYNADSRAEQKISTMLLKAGADPGLVANTDGSVLASRSVANMCLSGWHWENLILLSMPYSIQDSMCQMVWTCRRILVGLKILVCYRYCWREEFHLKAHPHSL